MHVRFELKVLSAGEERSGDEEVVGELSDRWDGDGDWIVHGLILQE